MVDELIESAAERLGCVLKEEQRKVVSSFVSGEDVLPTGYGKSLRGEMISAIACMSSYGLLDVQMFRGTSNGDIFNDFIQAQLIPHIMPYNGVNSHSVVILDNCSIHHVPEVIKSIEDVGALLIFLPPYSADLNPIEEMFSKVKYQHIKQML